MRGVLIATVTTLFGTSPAMAQAEPIAVKPKHVLPTGISPDTTRTDSTTGEAARPDSIATASRPNCWRAQRMPPCPGFFLTEFGIDHPLFSTRRNDRSPVGLARWRSGIQPDFNTRLTWTFGFMGTKGNDSHGATLSLVGDTESMTSRVPFTLEYRYRRWLRGASAFDASAGYRTADVWKDGTGLVSARGITAMAGYTFSPYIGVSLRGDLLRSSGRTRGALALGVRSTRLSEVFIKYTAIAVARAALAAIGIELSEEEDDS